MDCNTFSFDLGWVSISFPMEFEWFAMHFQLLLVCFYNGLSYVFCWATLCFLMGPLNSPIGFSFVFYWVPLAFLWAPLIILWVFACFLMDHLHSSVGFPLAFLMDPPIILWYSPWLSNVFLFVF